MHMKTLAALGLALVLGVGATGCGSASDSASAEPTVPATAPSTTASAAPSTTMAPPVEVPSTLPLIPPVAVDPNGNDVTPSGPDDVDTSSMVIPLNVPNRNDPKMRAKLAKIQDDMTKDWPWLGEVINNLSPQGPKTDDEKIDGMIDDSCASAEARENNWAMTLVVLGPILAPDLAKHDRTVSELMGAMKEAEAKAREIIGCA